MTKMSWDWLLGFIEGEGSFTISKGIVSKKKSKLGIIYDVYFQITQNYTLDNYALMQEISDFLKDNGIIAHFGKYRHQTWYNVTLRVSSMVGCRKLAEYLNRVEWHTKKKKAFNIWCEASEVIEKKEHLTPEGIIKMENLRDKIKETYKHSVKYARFDDNHRLKISKELYEDILKLHNEGKSASEIKDLLHVSLGTIQKITDGTIKEWAGYKTNNLETMRK